MTFRILAAVAFVSFWLFGIRPLAAALFALRSLWLDTLLPALTLAAPVGVPILAAGLVWLLILRVDPSARR